jgi:hypothetical protein
MAVTSAKGFQLRRAGLAPADPAADEAYLDGLAIVEPTDPKDPRSLPRPRALTVAERAAITNGTMQPPPWAMPPRTEAKAEAKAADKK